MINIVEARKDHLIYREMVMRSRAGWYSPLGVEWEMNERRKPMSNDGFIAQFRKEYSATTYRTALLV
jgi:hypothetical protein